MRFPLFIAFLALRLAIARDISTVPIPSSGIASLTRYDLPLGFVAACGCTANSTLYPTAALSQAAYGASIGTGPGCGQCFNLTITNSLLAVPQYTLPFGEERSIVVKITDKCPAPLIFDPDRTWCGATSSRGNKVGSTLHFDLASPSPSIPLSFFPPPPPPYGYDDFGAYGVRYEVVSCRFWAGFAANETGIDPSYPTGCCPTDLFVDSNATCAATSLRVSPASRERLSIGLAASSILLLLFFV